MSVQGSSNGRVLVNRKIQKELWEKYLQISHSKMCWWVNMHQSKWKDWEKNTVREICAAEVACKQQISRENSWTGREEPASESSVEAAELTYRILKTLSLEFGDQSKGVYLTNKQNKQNSVAFSPRANYTDWATATCRRNLVPTFMDRGVSRSQRGASLTVVNLSFLDRSR
jgi:hypothetical protein